MREKVRTCLGLAKCDMLIQTESKEVNQADGYVSLEFKGEVQSGGENFGITSTQIMVHKAMASKEIPKTVNKMSNDCTSGCPVFSSIQFIWNP